MRLARLWLTATLLLILPSVAYGQRNAPQRLASPEDVWSRQFNSGDLAGAASTANRMFHATPVMDIRGRAYWLTRQGMVLGVANNLDEAAATMRGAIEMLRNAHIVADTEFLALRGLTNFAARKGYLKEAFRTIKDALARSAALLGERHIQHAYNLSLLGMIEMARGRLPEAAVAFDKARHLFRQIEGDEGFGFEDNTARLATVRANQGLILKAIGLLDEALARFERKFTARFPPVVELRLNKADLLFRLDRRDEAAAAALRAYEDAKLIHPPHHPQIVMASARLVEKLNGIGRFDKAAAIISEALESASRRGRETPEYANLVLVSASVSFARGDIPPAIARARQAFALVTKLAPPEHPAVAPFLSALSQYEFAGGSLDEAARLGERALKIIQSATQMRGADPSITAGLLNRLSQIYAAQGRYAKAEPAMRRALDTYRDVYGSDHSVVLSGLYDLASQFNAQGRYAAGLSLARRALERAEQKFGDGHENTANMLISIAISLTNLGKTDEAETYFRRWEAIADRGGLPPTTMVFGLTNYGEFRRRNGQKEKATALFERAIAVSGKHKLLANSLAYARVYRARLLMDKEQFADAERALREMLRYFHMSHGEHSFEVLGLRRLIGETVARQGRLQEADDLLRDLLKTFEAKVGPDSPMLRDLLDLQKALYEKLDKPDRLAAAKKRLAALPPEGTRYLRLLFATNRAHSVGTSGFGTKDAGSLTVGVSTVRVPASEVTRQAERRARSLGQLHAAKGRLAETGKLKILTTDRNDWSAFISRFRKAAARASRFRGQAIVFIHGFNTDFEEALLRAGQIAFDLDFDGPIVAFSWPSRGSLLGYRADENAAAAATLHLGKVLARLYRQAQDVRIHMIAHSMGNRVLMNALDILGSKNKLAPGDRTFGEVILAHPDVDIATVERVARSARSLVRGFTLYATRKDTALAISRLLNWKGRAGATVKGIAGVDTIDVTGMKAADATGWTRYLVLNHSTFVRNPVLFGEITRLLQTGERPVHMRSFGHFEVSGPADERLWRYTGRDIPLGVAAKTEARVSASEQAAALEERGR